MLMWEIITSSMPWERMTVGQVFFAVVQEDARPPIPEELPESYRTLMTVRSGLSQVLGSHLAARRLWSAIAGTLLQDMRCCLVYIALKFWDTVGEAWGRRASGFPEAH